MGAKVKPLDVSNILRHAYLAGFVAAREIPAGDECDGRKCWLDFDPTNNPAYHRILSALDVSPTTIQDALALPEIAAVIGSAERLIDLYEEAGRRLGRSERKLQAALRAIGGAQ